MAEVTGLRTGLPYPVYGVPFGIVAPMLDADGDLVTGATTPDAEVSLNGNTFADCTNESTEIATNSGVYYLLLTGAEMTADVVTVIMKSATAGMKTSVVVLYPRKLVSLRAGTCAGGAAGSMTLDASASAVDDFYNGCLVVGVLDSTTEARIITDYTGSTQVAAVTPNWNTTPDSDDTFTVYLPEGRQIEQANVTHWNSLATVALPLVPATAGRSLVVDSAGLADANTVKVGPTASGTAQTARDLGASVLLSSGTGTGQVKLASGYIAPNWGDVGSPTTTLNLSGTTVKTATDVEARDVDIQARLPAALTAGGNIKAGVQGFLDSVFTEGAAGRITAAVKQFFNIASPAATMDHGILVDTVTTYTGNTPQTGDAYARIGATGSGLTTLATQASVNTIDDFLDTEVAAILADTNELQTDWADGGRLDLILDSAATAGDPWNTSLPGAYGAGKAGKIIGDNINATISSRASQSSVDTVDDFLDTEIAAIKAKTDNLPASPANEATLTTIAGYLDTEVAAILAAVDTEVAAIKAKTDLIPGTIDGKTFSELVTLIAAVLLGKASGLATTTAVYRAVNDSKARVTATVDADGNRSALTLDAS
jgi:hypothetical protein